MAKKSIGSLVRVSLFLFWQVTTFITAAVDKLMESDFHKKIEKGKDAPIIADRDTAIAML